MLDVLFTVGHQSYSPGAAYMGSPGPDDDVYEYWFNKPIVAETVDQLNRLGVKAKMGLYEDPGGWRAWSGQSKLLVEAHCNAFDTTASGTETLYWHSSMKGQLAAQAMQEEMVDALGLADRGIKSRNSFNRGAYLLRGLRQVVLITEPGFIDNGLDLERMKRTDMSLMYVRGIKAALEAIS